jgi:hypothetical protein
MNLSNKLYIIINIINIIIGSSIVVKPKTHWFFFTDKLILLDFKFFIYKKKRPIVGPHY